MLMWVQLMVMKVELTEYIVQFLTVVVLVEAEVLLEAAEAASPVEVEGTVSKIVSFSHDIIKMLFMAKRGFAPCG